MCLQRYIVYMHLCILLDSSPDLKCRSDFYLSKVKLQLPQSLDTHTNNTRPLL